MNVKLASKLRTNTGERLTRNISLARIHNSLSELFVDRTNIDSSSLGRFVDMEFENRIYLSPGDAVDENKITILNYNHCLHLNDEKTIKHNSKDVFDESRQIWIPHEVDVVKDNMFIPRSDTND